MKNLNNNSQRVVDVRGLSKVYGSGAVAFEALKDIDFHADAGEFVMISGPSGSGKTTLLSILGCVLRPTAGNVVIFDRDISAAREDELPSLRLGMIGFVFQGFNLIASLTASENIALILKLRGWSPREAKREAEKISTAAGNADERSVVPIEGLVAGNAIVELRQPSTKVASSVPARIAAIFVHEGQTVKRGSVLVQLENAPQKAALEATMKDFAAAKARADMSSEAFSRTEQAAKGGAATADELDKARQQAESDRFTLEATEARRDQANTNLEQLTVKAPIDGEILQVKYRAGEYVTPGGDPLVVMGDMSVLRVRVDVDERDIGRITVGDSAFVTADAYPG